MKIPHPTDDAISLKEYFDRILQERDRQHAHTFDAQEKAIAKAEASQVAYNNRANEFRETLSDQATRLLSKDEAEVRFKQLWYLLDAQGKILNELQRSESRAIGSEATAAASKARGQWLIGLVIGLLVTGLGGITSLVFYLATHH